MRAQGISQFFESGMREVDGNFGLERATEQPTTHHQSGHYSQDTFLHSLISSSNMHTPFTAGTGPVMPAYRLHIYTRVTFSRIRQKNQHPAYALCTG